ncbi:MAG: polyphosphate kinase 2 family protein [Blastocatellia bacterium]
MKKLDARADEIYKRLIVRPGSKISLAKDYDPAHTADFVKKEEADNLLQEGLADLVELQETLYAQDTYAVLIIFQALDAAGKDGTIKHVMSGLNPQGCQVYSFKAPSEEELDHDYLWRSFKALPERGRIGIFNRSHYEETLVVRVHPEILARQRIPAESKNKGIWKRRFAEINAFEKYLVANGIIILKFFLHVSKQEQKKRFLDRIDQAEKNWKFSVNDVKERAFWDDYIAAYEDVFNHTSTEWAPWHIIPADRKWFTRLAVGWVILDKLRKLKLNYPTLSEQRMQELQKAKEILENEK